MAPQPSAVRIRRLGKTQNIAVPADEVTRPSHDTQIDVWLIFGIPLVFEDTRNFWNDQRSPFERGKESLDELACQYRKLLPHARTCQYISDFGENLPGQLQLDCLQFNQ